MYVILCIFKCKNSTVWYQEGGEFYVTRSNDRVTVAFPLTEYLTDMLGKAARVVVDVDIEEDDWCWEGVQSDACTQETEEEGTAEATCTPTCSTGRSLFHSGGEGTGRMKARKSSMFGRRGIFGGLEQSCCARLSDEYDPHGGLLVSPVARSAWQRIEEGVRGGEVLKAWVNDVLCPWDGELNGARRASIESSVEIYAHKEVLRARMMGQVGGKEEGLFAPVDRVCKSLERDVLRLAMDVVRGICPGMGVYVNGLTMSAWNGVRRRMSCAQLCSRPKYKRDLRHTLEFGWKLHMEW